MAGYEQVELDEPMAQARFTRSDYAQVLFHNICETYSVDKDLECRYTITSLLTPTNRDWVALYKVGWSSAARDYVFYSYAPMPKNIEEGKDIEGLVHFAANRLPKDDGEFYQFCYVAGSGQVRGASTPFQFCSMLEDFIEIEDEDNDIMVIRSRTAVLEDDLNRALEEEKTMKKTVELLERERDSLLSKIVDLQRECETERQDKEELQKDLKLTQEKVALCHQESAEMASYITQLNEKLQTVQQEKESIEARMNDNDTYVVSLREKIKELVNTKDALMGKNRNLEEEKDMYKSNFSSSESTLTGYKIEIDNLKKRLEDEERSSARYQTELTTFRSQIAEEKKKVDRQLSITHADKAHIQDLTEKLRNCEDKLMAAEQCKQMLNKELDTQQQAYEKISGDMEQSKSEAYSFKVKIGKLEDHGEKQEQCWAEQLKYAQGQLDEKTKENDKLQRDIDVWRQKFESMESEKKEEDEAPMFALQMAQKTLKERLAKKHAENEEMKKVIDELMLRKRKWEQSDLDQKREIVGLKEHLLMGQESFRDKYIECQKLRADLKKSLRLNDKVRSRNSSETLLKQMSMESRKSRSEELELQTAADTEVKSFTPGEDEAATKSDLLTNTEVIVQLDNLSEELEKRKAAKNKYKQQLQEEKEKNAMLQRHYLDELEKNEDAMDRQKLEWRRAIEELQHKNRMMQSDFGKMQDTKETLEREVTRMMHVIEQQGHNTHAPPSYRYPAQQGMYTTGEAALAPVEPLPLRFGSPNTPVYPPQAFHNGSSTFQRPRPPYPVAAAPDHHPAPIIPTLASVAAAAAEEARGGPLPPPLEPELTADAKRVALMASINKTGTDDWQCEDVTAEDIFPDLITQQPTATAPQQPAEQPDPVDGDDERFMDAHGDPQQMCPVCQMIFPSDTAEQVFVSHIESHYGAICPVCSTSFPEGKPQLFQEHVESHFDD